MQELDVELRAGQLQGLGVVDLGVVHVQFAAGAVISPGPQQRIHQDVQVLADVVPRLDDVAAVAVDPGGKMRLDGLALVHHQRAVLEVADPQRPGLVPGPAAADFFLRDAQLPPRGPLLPQMPVEGGTRDLATRTPASRCD